MAIHKFNLDCEHIIAKMNHTLSKRMLKTIKLIGTIGDENGVNVFIAGGVVRDIVLEKKTIDLDIVVEGDAIPLAVKFAEKTGGTLVTYKRFGTSSVLIERSKRTWKRTCPGNKLKIDIISARKEKYRCPAALPEVEFSCLKNDLFRRDFTVNAMAISINQKTFGLFMDFFNGRRDIKKGIIRVLHNKSFIDDPTRILRAVRFEQRLGFKIEKCTEQLIKQAVKREMFNKTQNQRIREELILLLGENSALKSIFRMNELHELKFIHPELKFKKTEIKKTFSNLKKNIKWHKISSGEMQGINVWLMNFMLMTDNLTQGETGEVIKKFVFTRKESSIIRAYKENGKRVIKSLSSRKEIPASKIYMILRNLEPEVLLCVMSKTRKSVAGNRIKKFLARYRKIKLQIKGHDLKKTGFEPGPEYKRILLLTLCEKINGKFVSKQDEMRFALSQFCG